MDTGKTETAKAGEALGKAAEKLVTFIPAKKFTGWPQGYSKANRRGVDFGANVESIPVPQSFVDLMREKGLVATDKSTKADAGEKSKA